MRRIAIMAGRERLPREPAGQMRESGESSTGHNRETTGRANDYSFTKGRNPAPPPLTDHTKGRSPAPPHPLEGASKAPGHCELSAGGEENRSTCRLGTDMKQAMLRSHWPDQPPKIFVEPLHGRGSASPPAADGARPCRKSAWRYLLAACTPPDQPLWMHSCPVPERPHQRIAAIRVSRARADQRQSRNVTGFLTAAAPDRPARSECLLGGPRRCGIQISCAFRSAGVRWLSRVWFRCGA